MYRLGTWIHFSVFSFCRALTNGVTFLPKLHLIYLVNDILHHCVRKQVDELKNSLENIVIPMFCSAQISM